MPGTMSRIKGFISPAGWDASGNVDNLCLVTAPGKLYFLCVSNKDIDLFKYTKKSVIVEGKAFKKNGVSYMSVVSIAEAPASE